MFFLKYAFLFVQIAFMEEEDLSKHYGFFIRCSKLKESTKSYKFLSSEIVFKSPKNTFSNVTKYMESLQDKLCNNIDLLFLEGYMHLLSVFSSNGSLEKSFITIFARIQFFQKMLLLTYMHKMHKLVPKLFLSSLKILYPAQRN